nr:alpha/beta hydrolase [Oceanococcus sp. HetDA_MAG_MS8]
MSTPALEPALPGQQWDLDSPLGTLRLYGSQPPASQSAPRPLLLVHSINAAASAREWAPVFHALGDKRPVYALDLPGYGHSARPAIRYTPRLMTDAIHQAQEHLQSLHPLQALDAMGLSLSCEFLARAAKEQPAAYATLGLVSPTGFNRDQPWDGPELSHRGKDWLYRNLTRPLWKDKLFSMLTSRTSVAFFLRKTFGSKDVPASLIDYAWKSAHQPGAAHAPFDFLSGFLFSADSTRLYDSLRMPVWMAHGNRGDFTDYRRKRFYTDRPNWTIQQYSAGALPHYDRLPDFLRDYEAFLQHNRGLA